MNMVFHDPKCVMSMGIGHDWGLTDVPEAMLAKYMLAPFMSTMFMPGMEL